jgi:hypothetical protein
MDLEELKIVKLRVKISRNGFQGALQDPTQNPNSSGATFYVAETEILSPSMIRISPNNSPALLFVNTLLISENLSRISTLI